MGTTLRVCDATATTLAITIDGVEWSGIAFRHENGAYIVEGGGEIAETCREALNSGVVPEPYAPYQPRAITSYDVDTERDRRIAVIQFNGKTYDGGDLDRARIDRAKSNALAAIINGAQPGDLRWADASVDFAWIASDNTSVPMDAETCLAFGLAADAWEGRHIVAARALKNMVPIPLDYATNAAYWPS